MLSQFPRPQTIRSFTRTALCFVVLLLIPYAARAEVDIPDTPAGHTLLAFLDAFNSAEHDRIAAYVKEYDPDNSADARSSRVLAELIFVLPISHPQVRRTA